MKSIKYTLSFMLAIPLMFQTLIANAQSIGTTSSYACAGSGEVVFFIMGGSNCQSPYVPSQSSWTVSGGSASVTHVQTGTNPVAYNQIRVTFNSAATYTVSASYDCSFGGSSGSANPTSITIYSSSTPSVSISSNKTTICGGGLESVTFTASPTNGGTSPSYQWTVNGSDVSGQTGSQFTTSSLNNGDVVRANLLSNKQCASPTSAISNPISISVSQPAAVTVSIQQVTQPPICPGAPIAFSSTGSNWGTPTSYDWLINGNPVTPPDNGGASPLFYFIDNTWDWPTGTTVQLRVYSGIGCASPKPQLSNVVTVNLSAKENFTAGLTVLPSKAPPLAYCVDEIYFQASGSHAVASYQWYKNGSPVSNNNPSPAIYDPVTMAQGDIVSVLVSAQGNPCLNNTTSQPSVSMNGSPFSIKSPVSVSSITCATADAAVCSSGRRCQGGGTTDFNATANNADNFAWTIANAGSSTIDPSTGVVTWSSAFVGTATITFTANGCNGPAVSTRQIIVDPFGGNVTVSINQVTSPPICPGGPIAFSSTGTNWGTPTSYDWLINGSPVVPPDNGGMSPLLYFIDNTWDWPTGATVQLRVNSSVTCATPKPQVSNVITVNLSPKVNFTGGLAVLPSKAPPLAYCPDEIYFQASASHPVTSYSWYKNGSSVSNNHANPAIYDPVTISQGDVISVIITAQSNPCLNNTTTEPSVAMNGSPFSIKSPVSITSITCATADAAVCSSGRRCQGGGTTDFNATASNADNFTWTIANAGGSTIDPSTGVVTWSSAFVGTATVTFTANGCNGPAVSTRQIIVDPFGGNVTVSINQVTSPPICSGGPIAFSSSGTNWGTTPTSYEWLIGGTPTVPPDNPPNLSPLFYYIDNTWDWPTGTTVQLRVTSSVTCATPKPQVSNLIPVTLTAKQNFTAGIAVLPSKSPPLAYCEDEISFQANSSHPAQSYTWYKNEQNVTDSNPDPAIFDPIFIAQGDLIKVVVTAQSNPCLNNTTAEFSVPMNASPFSIKSPVSVTPVSCATPDNGVCNSGKRCKGGGTTDFNASASNADNFSWTIENAGASTIDPTTGVVTWESDFTGTATVHFTANGCNGPASSSKNILVEPTYDPPSVEIAGSSWVCPGTHTYFQTTSGGVVNGGPNPTYQWWLGGNMISNENQGIPPYRLDIANWQHGDNVEIKVVLSTGLSCQTPNTTTSNIVTVRSTLGGVVISPEQGQPDRCQGAGTTQFAASPALTNYVWQLTAGGAFSNISTSGLVTWDPQKAGDAYVGIFAGGCASAATSLTYTVKPAPVATSTQSIGACNWEYVTINAMSSTGYANWYDNSNNLLHSGTTFQPGFHYNPGTYSYWVESESFQSCKSLSKSLVQVNVTDQCNDKMNWIEAKRFRSDNSVVSNSRSYFDFSGNPLQTQSKSFHHANTLFTAQNLKDRYDRTVGSTLMAPVTQSDFNYVVKFAWSNEGRPYDYRDFDDPANPGSVMNPAPISDSPGTLGWFYSPNNTAEDDVPVTQYPYSRAEFYADGSGEVKLTATAGDFHRMGAGHETLTGVFPVFAELNEYLEKRAIAIPNVTQDNNLINEGIQNINRDENGKIVITMTDKSGKTVMTCREGTVADHILSIPNHVQCSGDPASANYRPMTYFYLLEKQPVIITGSTDFVAENIVTNERKAPGVSFADANGDWPAGFYRILLSNTVSEITVDYTNRYLDVSYQFYDDAGRFKASLTPNGYVQQKANGGVFYNANPADPTAIIDLTCYSYNQLGWILSRTEPDAGKIRYVYRKDGKIRFSQNAEQKKNGRFSYTHYDHVGRPVESGEYRGTNIAFIPMDSSAFATSKMNAQLNKTYAQLIKEQTDGIQVPPIWVPADVKDWVRTHYDVPVTSEPSIPASLTQEFIRGSISWTENINIKTWYSYDESGRISWIAQKPAALNRSFVTTYSYDFLGNVETVKSEAYVGGTALDPFYHHYEFDGDNRLSEVYTSTDGISGKIRATYKYYIHGPLKRIELGDKIQGIDFVYNINGWLTQINHPDGGAADPGKDGQPGINSDVRPDVFGMVLDYYESALEGIFQTSGKFKPQAPEIFHHLPDLNGSDNAPSLAYTPPILYFRDQLLKNYQQIKQYELRQHEKTDSLNKKDKFKVGALTPRKVFDHGQHPLAARNSRQAGRQTPDRQKKSIHKSEIL